MFRHFKDFEYVSVVLLGVLLGQNEESLNSQDLVDLPIGQNSARGTSDNSWAASVSGPAGLCERRGAPRRGLRGQGRKACEQEN